MCNAKVQNAVHEADYRQLFLSGIIDRADINVPVPRVPEKLHVAFDSPFKHKQLTLPKSK